MKILSSIASWFKDRLIFFGPGLLLAITAAGEAGITEALEIGAHFGLSLIWVVIIALLFKYAFTTGIARYTLATGKTIFEGINSLPGPKNWGMVFTIVSYLIETLSVGAMILFCATFVNYLLPGVYSLILIGVFILVLAMLVLRTHVYHHFEKVMAAMVLFMGVMMVIVLVTFPFNLDMVLGGVVPNIPEGSETSILAIIGVVGSGLNLMLYSVWLEKKIRIKHNSDLKTVSNFRKYLKSVKSDIAIGFIIVALVTIGFMAIGYAGFQTAFLPHGTHLTLDTLISFLSSLSAQFPFGVYILMIFLAIIFFGSVTVGLDARASAITKIIKRTRAEAGKPVKNPSIIYNLCLLVFAALMLIAILINSPMQTIRTISVICAVLFGIFGLILLYLNTKLPAYARGSRLWMLFIGIGSVVAIFVALLLEGSILTHGVEILKNLLLCLLAVYIFVKSKMFKRCVEGTANLADKFWLVIICGAISIYGTFGGVDLNGYILNFRDLGPMLAGFIGGPVPGLIAALIGGIYRLSLGGATAVPCLIATIAAGLIAGFAARYWKGQLTVPRVIIVAIIAECLHILSIFPTYVLLAGTMDAYQIFDVISSTLLSMIIVNGFGLVCFAYFARDSKLFAGSLQRFSLKKLIQELKDLVKQGDDII